MTRTTFCVGAYGVNCTLLVRNGRGWVVDPGADAAAIERRVKAAGVTLAGLLLTHGHFDHIGAVPALQKAHPGLPLYVGAADAAILTHPFNACPPEYPPIPQPSDIRPFSELAETLGLVAIATPGHTPGGVCLHFPAEKLLLSGDTLFAGSVGRTDLPGGDMPTLVSSLRKLQALPPETTVVPGHGPETTIGAECASNPFLRG